jgi:hypothetical protein
MAGSDREIALTIDGKEHRFELTLGELEEIEDAFDKPLDEINFGRTKAVLLLVKFAKLRENPGQDPARLMASLRSQGVDLLESIGVAAAEESPTKKPAKRAGASAPA